MKRVFERKGYIEILSEGHGFSRAARLGVEAALAAEVMV